jgi:hypothetical protein
MTEAELKKLKKAAESGTVVHLTENQKKVYRVEGVGVSWNGPAVFLEGIGSLSINEFELEDFYTLKPLR